jgi:hypothetical protein
MRWWLIINPCFIYIDYFTIVQYVVGDTLIFGNLDYFTMEKVVVDIQPCYLLFYITLPWRRWWLIFSPVIFYSRLLHHGEGGG